MKQKRIRYFGGFFTEMERWLNRMAQKGFRLKKAGKLVYEFEPCASGEYQYCVEFTGHRSFRDAQDYRQFLAEMGYRVLTQGINLNFSLLKVRWRPYGKGWGQIATSPGTYGRELFIVEKRSDGATFALHTAFADKADYYKPIRNMWGCSALLWLLASAWLLWRGEAGAAFFLSVLIGILSLLPAFSAWRLVRYYTCLSREEES